MRKSLDEDVRVLMQKLSEFAEMALETRDAVPAAFEEYRAQFGEHETRKIARNMILQLDAYLNGDMKIRV